jgi:hypothetical protein
MDGGVDGLEIAAEARDQGLARRDAAVADTPAADHIPEAPEAPDLPDAPGGAPDVPDAPVDIAPDVPAHPGGPPTG